MRPATSSATRNHISLLGVHPLVERFAMASIVPQTARIFAGALPLGQYPHPRNLVDMSLFEMDPRELMDGEVLDNGMFMAPDPVPVGNMRETCPYCDSQPLQLVLRRHHVKRSHLFCPHCTRCYDILNVEGYSMLDIV